MIDSSIKSWSLTEIVDSLVGHYPKIKQLYLFGSRAYQTNSLRSDIDILALTDGDLLNEAEINDWLPIEYPPVDLFWSYDGIVAKSVANGSTIRFRKDDPKNFKNLQEQLDAILLWDKVNGMNDDIPDVQKALNGISFPMSIIPKKWDSDAVDNIELALKQIEESGVHTYFAGRTIREISEAIIDIIKTGMEKPKRFQNNARSSFTFEKIKLCNEYDFQTFIHLLLRPIFKDIEPEPLMVIIDGNKKKADFGINRNQIIIEAKWIDSASKKDEVLKTLDGLSSFYSDNPRMKSLILFILYSETVKLDRVVLTERFAQKYSELPIYICFLENTYR